MGETLKEYQDLVDRWLPDGRLVVNQAPEGPDAMIQWTRGNKPFVYLVEHKRNLATQDVLVVATQLDKFLEAAKGRHTRALLLAPYVRAKQADFLRDRGIDYIDLAGNTHIEAPGVFVHVEGRRPLELGPEKNPRLTRGWIKTVLAFIVKPELLNQPYRAVTVAADVALGTVTVCMKDLHRRGLIRETKQGRVVANLEELVALWVQAYREKLRPKLNVRKFQMREADMRARWFQLEHVLRAKGIAWALTGADGAANHRDFLTVRETEIYADPALFTDKALLTTLVAQPAARQPNLLVIEPPGPLAIPEQQTRLHRVPIAPLLLCYAELRARDTDQAHEAAEMLLPALLANAEN